MSDCEQEGCDEFCEQDAPMQAVGCGAAHGPVVLTQDNTE